MCQDTGEKNRSSGGSSDVGLTDWVQTGWLKILEDKKSSELHCLQRK